MFNLFRPRSERLALKVERNMIAMEKAADAGNWEVVAYACIRQEQLLAVFQRESDWSEKQFEDFITSRGLVRAIKDTAYRNWIMDELVQRNLLPM